MVFLSETPAIRFERPLFAAVLGNTLLSTVPGISGAGPSPQGTLLTPILDAELVLTGAITSRDATPNTPTGCPTPASVTRAALALAGLVPLFVNAGLAERPTVPCLDVYGAPGQDPRSGPAVPDADRLVEGGRAIGRLLSSLSDLLVLGECVPGGTTTALCVLRALGHPARTSSSVRGEPERAEGGRRPQRPRAARAPRPALARTRSSPRPATPCSRSRRGSRRRTRAPSSSPAVRSSSRSLPSSTRSASRSRGS